MPLTFQSQLIHAHTHSHERSSNESCTHIGTTKVININYFVLPTNTSFRFLWMCSRTVLCYTAPSTMAMASSRCPLSRGKRRILCIIVHVVNITQNCRRVGRNGTEWQRRNQMSSQNGKTFGNKTEKKMCVSHSTSLSRVTLSLQHSK